MLIIHSLLAGVRTTHAQQSDAHLKFERANTLITNTPTLSDSDDDDDDDETNTTILLMRMIILKIPMICL
ncbi:hypothetical protein PoB_005643300 [Plakobranchus ocellatus]|uniref:Secreted protein n=1 Tax=Plakobranchus ocellatus TaxID=259542 RepID=A0AAV4CEM6_9GAST|nr:hypothetical protein PoB_005643300 [Plakobranchus ocellatus]